MPAFVEQPVAWVGWRLETSGLCSPLEVCVCPHHQGLLLLLLLVAVAVVFILVVVAVVSVIIIVVVPLPFVFRCC